VLLVVGGGVERVVEVVLLQELVVLLQGHTVDAVPDCAGGNDRDSNLVLLDEVLETVGLDLNDFGLHFISI
jgi:hypothetical protein